jgi:hypothetical protein
MLPLTDVQAAVVRDPALTVDVGCDLWTDDGWVDISESFDPDGSTLEAGSYRTIHRTCTVGLSRQLDWGKDRIRLRMSLTSRAGTFEVVLGVFVLSTPATVAGEDPRTFTVEGYDLLEFLNRPHGETFVATAGSGYLANARTLIEAAGLSVSFVDETSDQTVGTARIWPIDEQTTTLNIVNDLLAAVGFRGLHMTRDGVATSEPYQAPADRGVEWEYDATVDATTVGETRTAIFDFFDAPNRLVAICDDPETTIPPVVLNNVDEGVTSQTARGRVIPAVLRFEAANATALAARAREAFDRMSRVAEEFTVTVGPNPAHFLHDIVRFADPDLNVNRKCVVRSFKLPLDGGDMTLDMRAVDAINAEFTTITPPPAPSGVVTELVEETV